MLEEKIRCQFCGRRNHINNDLCDSCGAWLPDPVAPNALCPWDDLTSLYLNNLVTYSAFTYRNGQLVEVRP